MTWDHLYLLDTNAVSDLIAGQAQIVSWIASLSSNERVITCPIVQGEIWYGVEVLAVGRKQEELRRKARQILSALPCEPVPPRAGEFYAAVKIARQRLGLAMADNDLWIAATALAVGATLVSRDRDFRQIDGLPVLIFA